MINTTLNTTINITVPVKIEGIGLSSRDVRFYQLIGLASALLHGLLLGFRSPDDTNL